MCCFNRNRLFAIKQEGKKKGDIFLLVASLLSLLQRQGIFSLLFFFLLNVLCLIKGGNQQILTNNNKETPYSSGWLMAVAISGM